MRELEAELAQYMDDDDEYPDGDEQMVRPGGLVRLKDAEEARYLGPSSGIAMTRLLMEQAKRYTDSGRVAELVPKLDEKRAERLNRMQSIVGFAGSVSGPAGLNPRYADGPATELPLPGVVDLLVDVYNQKCMCHCWPAMMGSALT